LLTAERLKETLQYDPVTGVFCWLKPSGARVIPGQIAGCVKDTGHRRIAIDGNQHQAHRLAWLYMTGEWPSHHVDHINQVRDDNRWINLRLATRSQNAANSSTPRASRTGVRGVDWFEDRGLFRARIVKNRKLHSLGYFKTSEEASAAYLAARERMFGAFSPNDNANARPL
jgi:hypothetical protein